MPRKTLDVPRRGRGGPRDLEPRLRALEVRLLSNSYSRRSKIARSVARREDAYLADEPESQITTRLATIAHRAAFVGVLLDCIESYVTRKGSVLTEHGELLPTLAHAYDRYVERERRALVELGLRPSREPRELTLAQYLQLRGNPPQTPPDAQNGATGDERPADVLAPAPAPDEPPEAA